jgi:hypothetical protein
MVLRRKFGPSTGALLSAVVGLRARGALRLASTLDDVTEAPRPGWYPDPADVPDRYRWWDGRTWTDHLALTPNAPAPAAETAGSRKRSLVQIVVALGLVVALILGAGVGVGFWLWGDDRRAESTGAGSTPSKAPTSNSVTAEPPGQLDESSRTASIGAASMQLPDEPYELRSDPKSVPGILDVAFVAEATVHARYDGEHDWPAMVALAAINPALAQGSSVEQAGRTALVKLSPVLYGGHPTRITRVRLSDRSVDGHPGVELRARISYAVDRLPSRYDTVQAVVVRLEDGTLVAAISSVPNDADDDLAEMAEESLDSLEIR